MSRSALTAGLRYLRGIVASQQYREDSDEQLLYAFAFQRDDSAFAVLVRRHGPMVLHVCRRVLGQEQDAEDAFQATFLVLARSAAKLRKKAALASFLHGTAYRLALSARRAAARRRKHEGQTPARPSVDPTDDISWREVRALLDEEIERLPEKYRSVFILCCLEELSRAEAAQRLGLKEGAVSYRLTVARQRLQRRLARRGVELTAVLTAATLAAQPASALSPVLVSSTIQAALGEGTAGLVSAPVAELVKSAASKSIWRKIAVLLALAAGVVAVGAASRAALHREPPTPPADPPRVEARQAAVQKPTNTLTVRGRVLDPDGKPVKGARLYWPLMPKTPRSEDDIQNSQRAKTDADGRFHFELPRADIHPEKIFPVLAAADGYGADWAELSKLDAPAELMLRLVKDHPIEGRIISTEGKPLPGVTVRAFAVSKPRGRLDDFLSLWKQDWRRALQQQTSTPLSMLLPSDEKSTQAVTDKDGRFRLGGAGAERLVLVSLRGARVSQAMLWVVNRAGFDPALVNKVVLQNTPADESRLRQLYLLYGPTIEYVAPAGRRIEGTVREAGTGKPVPGFLIFGATGHVPSPHAVTDKDGRYKLEDQPKLNQYVLVADPPANSSWLRTGARVQDKEALQPITVDFTVARGLVVNGRVIDRKTGKGVSGYIRFVPLPANKFAGKPGHDSFKYGNLSDDHEASSDGRFRLAVMPGPIVLMFQARGGQEANGGPKVNPYKQAEFDAKDLDRVKIIESDDGDRQFTVIENRTESLTIQSVVKVLDLAPDAGPVQCDLYLDRGTTRTIRIEDNEGKPLTGTTVAGVTALGRRNYTIKDATCTVFALDPKKPRRLLLLHIKRNLAGTLMLRGDEKEPVVVRLGQTGAVTGRMLGSDGQPLAGADVNLILSDMSGFELYREARNYPTVRTDKDGRFRLEGIMPEMKFTLGIMRGRTVFTAEPSIGTMQVKQGETRDLGDLRVKLAR